MKSFLNKILPSYAWVPVLMCIGANLLAFYLTRPFTAGMHHFTPAVPLDSTIPFIPAFITVYVLSYVQWGLGYIAIGRENKNFCYRYFSALFLAKIICLIFFVALPTSMVRPDATGNDIFSFATRFIYSADTPDNLFPSIHCLDSTLFAIAILRAKSLPKWWKVLNIIFTVAVYFSVLFVKQHLIADVVGGIALALICLLVSHRFHGEKLFYVFGGNKK